jgi:hypothetical protein
MPQSGKPCPDFIAEAARSWQNLYQLAAPSNPLPRAADVDGRWRSPKGDRWWQVWTCDGHTEGLTGLRQFGG